MMTLNRQRIFAALLLGLAACRSAGAATEPPNIVLIVCDNLGYGDVGCYGSTVHRTPRLDRMAAEGMRFTHFYVTSGVCTPSRASLVTGCYPRRVNMHVSDTGGKVLQPVSPKGLHPDEITVAETLKAAGYATSIIGKWHLGDQPEFLPTRQGFDEYLGIPYSDDMTQREGKPWPPLPLMRNETVIEAPADRDLLTKRYTEAAVDFMERHGDRPFFLYMPQAMPGSTRAPFASEDFRGKSANGPYGDSVEELDWSTGVILDALKRLELEDHTLVIWTSDNGAPRRNPPQGSNLPLKGWGYDGSEGAMRVPCIARWPDRIPAGVTCHELCSTLDFHPTFAALAGTNPPGDRHLDGYDMQRLLWGVPETKSAYKVFYYYDGPRLHAVRSGPWKLYLGDAPQLFNLVTDVDEQHDVAAGHPKVVLQLQKFVAAARLDLGDGAEVGSGQRPAGWVDEPTARVIPQ